ncbi:MAG: hypothetical protein JXA03_11195 [Bacteroidales bacterium]|nr:hypothetical protein [Bacteroidales bacterium]
MKATILFVLGVFIFGTVNTVYSVAKEKDTASKGSQITLLCTPDMKDLAVTWIGNYSDVNPDAEIKLVTINPGELSGKTIGEHNLALITGAAAGILSEDPAWMMTIGRDIVVPVINSKNPYLDIINQKGLTLNDLAAVFSNPDVNGWGSVLGGGNDKPVNLYILDNETIRKSLQSFAGEIQMSSRIGIVKSGKELVSAIQNDPLGIGFCRLTDVVNPGTSELETYIRLLPIDKNGNGQMDSFEKIFDNANDFTRGAWIGKYPRAMIHGLYLVSKSLPDEQAEVAFIKWILTQGQSDLETYGHNGLVYNERQANLEKFNHYEIIGSETSENYAIQKIALLILVILVAGGIAANLIVRRRWRKSGAPVRSTGGPKVITEENLVLPNGFYFDKSHTWVYMEKDGNVKVGIDDFLPHVTGNYTRVAMKNPGDPVRKNEHLLTLIQDGKQLKIYSPVSGKIVHTNKNLVTHPALINSSPYDAGWLYRIEPSNWLREIQFLFMGMKYREWIGREFRKLKDFLAASVNAGEAGYAVVALQDGGELQNNVLQDLSPQVWEDFQKNFIEVCD